MVSTPAVDSGAGRDFTRPAIRDLVSTDRQTASTSGVDHQSRVNANGGRQRYRAWLGMQRARQQCRRPRAIKLHRYQRLKEAVEQGLAKRWSPQQIARRLKQDYPDEPTMHVSHETIYRALFVQSRGSLKKELTRPTATRFRSRLGNSPRVGLHTTWTRKPFPQVELAPGSTDPACPVAVRVAG